LLFCNIVFIRCSSNRLLFLVMGYVFILFIKYRIAVFLCSVGWHELLCMMISVVVGFLCMSKVSLLCTFLIVMSKKFSVLLICFLWCIEY
jgi:hypothetical protein